MFKKIIIITIFILAIVVIIFQNWSESHDVAGDEPRLIAVVKDLFPDSSQIRIDKRYKEWALVAVGFDPGGGTLVIMKFVDGWQHIADGNEIWDCRIMKQYGVPKKIYNQCKDY